MAKRAGRKVLLFLPLFFHWFFYSCFLCFFPLFLSYFSILLLLHSSHLYAIMLWLVLSTSLSSSCPFLTPSLFADNHPFLLTTSHQSPHTLEFAGTDAGLLWKSPQYQLHVFAASETCCFNGFVSYLHCNCHYYLFGHNIIFLFHSSY